MAHTVSIQCRRDQAETAIRLFEFAMHAINVDAGAGAYVTRRLSADIALEQIGGLLEIYRAAVKKFEGA